MRRIKFRGKREDNGEWVYGAFYPIKDEHVYFIINNCQSIDFDDNSTFFNGYKVQKKSVGEFTGLHDKNGKEIYEGDWCCAKFMTKNDNKVIQGLIIMDEFMWCIDCTGNLGDDIFSINRIHDVEVIGNIHEDSCLLE